MDIQKKGHLFGTSGIRGDAKTLFTNQFAFDLGRSFAQFLSDYGEAGSVAVGMDPRESSPRIKEYVISGLIYEGREVYDEGVSPVPASYVYMNSSPIKVLEYLALEIPVVGTDIPDQRFVIENSGGGVCVGWDAGQLSEGINKLLGLSSEQRKLIGRKGRAWVSKNRDFSVLAQKVADTYDRLILAVGRSGSKEKKE